jgi:hypothetical protein
MVEEGDVWTRNENNVQKQWEQARNLIPKLWLVFVSNGDWNELR